MRYVRGERVSFFRSISITNWLIGINVVLFFVFHILNYRYENLYDLLAIKASDIFAGKQIWTIITSMFTHESGFHLFVNMFSLYFLGNFSEKIVGRKRFIWLYLLAGVVGGIAFVGFAKLGMGFAKGAALFGGFEDAAVGASGAIFGLLGLLAVLVPKNRVYLIIGPLILIIINMILVRYIPESFAGFVNIVFIFLIFLMLFSMLSFNSRLRALALPVAMPLWMAPIVAIVPLMIISFYYPLPIGNTAHFGGLVAGLAFGFYLRYKYRKKVMMLRRYFR